MVPHFNNVVSTGAQKFPDYTAGKITFWRKPEKNFFACYLYSSTSVLTLMFFSDRRHLSFRKYKSGISPNITITITTTAVTIK